MVEQFAVNELVVGSSPTSGANVVMHKRGHKRPLFVVYMNYTHAGQIFDFHCFHSWAIVVKYRRRRNQTGLKYTGSLLSVRRL